MQFCLLASKQDYIWSEKVNLFELLGLVYIWQRMCRPTLWLWIKVFFFFSFFLFFLSFFLFFSFFFFWLTIYILFVNFFGSVTCYYCMYLLYSWRKASTWKPFNIFWSFLIITYIHICKKLKINTAQALNRFQHILKVGLRTNS